MIDGSFFVTHQGNEGKIFNINALNYISIKYNASELLFLIDTGASISCIFDEFVDNSIIDVNKRIKIQGITGATMSLGETNLSFTINNEKFLNNFIVVKKFDSYIHGVLGTDFLMRNKASINYEKFTITLQNQNGTVTVPLQSKSDYYTIVPPRCEIIKYCYTIETEDCVIMNDEICEGVILASSIVRPVGNRVPVKIMNINEREIRLKNFQPKISRLKDYEMCQFSKNEVSVERVERILDLINRPLKNDEERDSIDRICVKFADIFHLEGDPLTVTNIFQQKIRLKQDAHPVYIKPYRLPHAQKEEIHAQIEKMVENGICEAAKSQWSAPLLIVPKKADSNGLKSYRVVLDYRGLNRQLSDDEKFPLPNITEILDSLSGAVYFSHLDLAQGYHQVELHPGSRPCTAFTTERGQFQMKRLPMGLKISPHAFSRLMTVAMSGLNYESCFVYLDDLIVFGNSLQNHNRNLIKVFQRLREANLKLNPKKCEFLKKEILYLGHVISSDGIAPDPEKIGAIRNYPAPKNADEVKRFVAFANYYRKFIKNFAEIAQPLNSLSRKGKIFQWTEACKRSFEVLKQALIDPPLLQYPDFSKGNEFILRTDASGFAVGAVLSNSDDKPIAYASRSLNKAEKNYCTIEKELLAIVWAVKHFRPYLYARKFKILTDHRPLIYLFNLANPSSRLTKFRLVLEEYDFTVHYVKGSENVTADALSRVTIESKELKEMTENIGESIKVMTRAQIRNQAIKDPNDLNTTIEDDSRIDHPIVVEILKRPSDTVELRLSTGKEFNKLKESSSSSERLQHFNDFIYDVNSQIIFFNQNSRSAYDLGTSLRHLGNLCAKINIPELYIYLNAASAKFLKLLTSYKSQLLGMSLKINVVKDVERIEGRKLKRIILNDFHMLPTGGHAGVQRMYNNIKRQYFWSGLMGDIRHFVKTCDSCQRQKHSIPKKIPMIVTSTAKSAFEKVVLDLVGPIPTDSQDKKYILTLQCDLTKFVEGYAITDKEAKTVAKAFVENFVLRYGIPAEVLTDQGTEFMASTFKEACKLLNIQHLNSTAYHHETLGSLENSHKHLGAYLRMQLSKYSDTNWSDWVPYWCFSYNNTVNSSTRYTPYELVFGKMSKIPSNIKNKSDPVYNFDDYPFELKFRLQTAWNDARNNLIDSKTKRVIGNSRKNFNYNIGDMVLVKNECMNNKLDTLFKGPYKIVNISNTNIGIRINNKIKQVHKNMVKPYFTGSTVIDH